MDPRYELRLAVDVYVERQLPPAREQRAHLGLALLSPLDGRLDLLEVHSARSVLVKEPEELGAHLLREGEAEVLDRRRKLFEADGAVAVRVPSEKEVDQAPRLLQHRSEERLELHGRHALGADVQLLVARPSDEPMQRLLRSADRGLLRPPGLQLVRGDLGLKDDVPRSTLGHLNTTAMAQHFHQLDEIELAEMRNVPRVEERKRGELEHLRADVTHVDRSHAIELGHANLEVLAPHGLESATLCADEEANDLLEMAAYFLAQSLSKPLVI